MINTLTASVQSALQTPLFDHGVIDLTIERIAYALLALLVTFLITRFVDRSLTRLADSGRSVFSTSGQYATSRILLYTEWLIGIIITLRILGIDLTSLALFGGVVGIGLGLGLQSIFSNFVSGIAILIEKTLKVGDFVELESGASGRVSEINVRFTRITTNDFVDIIVPNSEFINGRVKNWSYDDLHRRIHVPFSVAYGSDKEIVKKAGLQAAAAVPDTVRGSDRDPDVWLVGFGESALNFELVVWVGKQMASTPGRTQADYLWKLEDALREHGLVVPFPQRDVHVYSKSIAP